MLALLCIAQFVDVLGGTSVVVALPSIGRDLDAGAQATQWVVSAYALCFGGFLLLAGRAADVFGRRRIFSAGMLVFVVASAACGLAPSAPALLAGRAIQGAAAAAAVPAALALLAAAYPAGDRRTWALGWWTAAAAGGGAVGFFAGGLMTATIGWRGIFLINVPIVLATLALTPRLLEESRGDGDRRLDVGGALLVTLGVGSLIAGLTLASANGLTSAPALLAVAAGAVLLAAFARVESRHASPLAPPAVLLRRGITGAAAVAFTLTATTSSAAILVTRYLQEVINEPPLSTGLIFLPFSVSVIAGSLVGPRVLARIGGRATLVVGMAAVTAGLLIYTAGGIGAVAAGLATSGAGLGVASVAATSIGMGAAERAEQGLVAGILNTATQLGTAAGVAVIPALHGLHTGWLTAAGIAATGGALVAVLGEWRIAPARAAPR